ncbi:hypothetical protein [Mangrovivirga cuniculi]|nr:hypothetical protein [Mangrovivirga cuniculi]
MNKLTIILFFLATIMSMDLYSQNVCGAKNDPVYAADIIVGRAEYDKYLLEEKAHQFIELYFKEREDDFVVSDSVIFIPLKLFLYELASPENRKSVYDSLRILDSYNYFEDYNDPLIPHGNKKINQENNVLYFSKPENNRLTAMVKENNAETTYFLFIFDKEKNLKMVKSVNSTVDSNRFSE